MSLTRITGMVVLVVASLAVTGRQMRASTTSSPGASSCAIEESYGVDFTAMSASSATNLWASAAGSEPVTSTLGHWNGTAWQWWCDAPKAYAGSLAAFGSSGVWTISSYPSAGGVSRWDGGRWHHFTSPVLSSVAPAAVAATGSREAWVAGNGIAFWNGRTWRQLPYVTQENDGAFDSVSASGPDNVWAIWSARRGERTALFHWNGHRWAVFHQGIKPLASVREFVAVVAPSPADVWVGGKSLEHWNGRTWKHYLTPLPSSYSLDCLAAARGSGVWVLGSGPSQDNNGDATLVFHENGHHWSSRGSPVASWYGAPAIAVAPSGRAVWTAGLYAVKRLEGSGWRSIIPTLPGVYGGNLDAVARVSKSEFWMAGDYDRSLGGRPYGLIERWDGMHGVVTYPALRNDHELFTSISGTSSRDVWVVGQASRARAFIQHWNGSSWKVVPNPLASFPGSSLASAAAVSPDNAWAAGTRGQAGVLEHWNGLRWMVVPGAGGPGAQVSSMAAISAEDIWAVGTRPSAESYESPFIEHWNGRAWRSVPAPDTYGIKGASASLGDVVATGGKNAWVTGCNSYGTDVNAFLDHWNGNAWSTASNSNDLGDGCVGSLAASGKELWGLASIVSPAPSLVVRWTKRGWTDASTPFLSGSATLNAVAGSGRDDMWAVGSGPAAILPNPQPLQTPIPIEHWNGSSWQLVLGPVPTW